MLTGVVWLHVHVHWHDMYVHVTTCTCTCFHKVYMYRMRYPLEPGGGRQNRMCWQAKQEPLLHDNESVCTQMKLRAHLEQLINSVFFSWLSEDSQMTTCVCVWFVPLQCWPLMINRIIWTNNITRLVAKSGSNAHNFCKLIILSVSWKQYF